MGRTDEVGHGLALETAIGPLASKESPLAPNCYVSRKYKVLCIYLGRYCGTQVAGQARLRRQARQGRRFAL